MFKNLPEDVIRYGIQPFIGKDKILYYNKYINEYRLRFNKEHDIYNKIKPIFENMSITYNKKGGGSVLEVGILNSPQDRLFCDLGITGYTYKYRITHIVYEYKNKLYSNTDLCRRIEYYDDGFGPDDGSYDDIAYFKYKNWYKNFVKI
jgi:hypothetical protein